MKGCAQKSTLIKSPHFFVGLYLHNPHKWVNLDNNISHLHLGLIDMNTAVSSEALTMADSTTLMGSGSLDQCAKGSLIRVVDIVGQPLFGSQDENVTLRLKELGFLPGVKLKVIGFGLLGTDPLAVQINGTKFALRRAEAAKIRIEAC